MPLSLKDHNSRSKRGSAKSWKYRADDIRVPGCGQTAKAPKEVYRAQVQRDRGDILVISSAARAGG
jgi:hypothetical protein